MSETKRKEALDYHSSFPKGKIETKITKPSETEEQLSLAYSPWVAEPCKEIHKDVQNVYEYTNKGNLVAVVSNGTAVLGLSLIHISEPTRPLYISYAVFCLKKK